MPEQQVGFARLTPMLRTKEVGTTVGFPTGLLGFRCESLREADGWASLRRDEIELMVATPNRHVPFTAPGFTGSFYLHVDDVSALWHAVKSRAEVCYPLAEFHYGVREFGIYDNNGYLLQFGSPTQS